MRPSLVIFDCDGVLVDSEPLSNQAIAELLNAHGLTLSAREVKLHLKRPASSNL